MIKLEDLGPVAQESLLECTQHEREFIIGFCSHGNATEAYVAASRANGGQPCTRETAQTASVKMQKRERVANIIREVKALQASRFEVSENHILRTYSHLAFSDIRDFYRDDGTLVPIRELPKHLADMIQSFETEEINVGSGENRQTIGTLSKVRLINRKDALDSLARTQGMFLTEKKKAETKAQVVRFPASEEKSEWQKKHG